MDSFAIILSGLPASGKTSVGRAIAKSLNIPCLDKDDLLEDLLEQRGIGDNDWRRRLSIEADGEFQKHAVQHSRVVLISHWRPLGMAGTGTPTDWLYGTFSMLVEVYCDCRAETAAERFKRRTRHAGHLDSHRTQAETLEWMRDLENGYPLLDENVFTVLNGKAQDISEVASKIRTLTSPSD